MFTQIRQTIMAARMPEVVIDTAPLFGKSAPLLKRAGKSFLKTTAAYAVVIVAIDGVSYAIKYLSDDPALKEPKPQRTAAEKVAHGAEATINYTVGVGVQATSVWPFVYIGIPGLLVTGGGIAVVGLVELPVRVAQKYYQHATDGEPVVVEQEQIADDDMLVIERLLKNFTWTRKAITVLVKYVASPTLWPSDFLERIGKDIKRGKRSIRRGFIKPKTAAEQVADLVEQAAKVGLKVDFTAGRRPDPDDTEAMKAYGLGVAMEEELNKLIRENPHLIPEGEETPSEETATSHFGEGGPAVSPEEEKTSEQGSSEVHGTA